jgi:hypothetical protein
MISQVYLPHPGAWTSTLTVPDPVRTLKSHRRLSNRAPTAGRANLPPQQVWGEIVLDAGVRTAVRTSARLCSFCLCNGVHHAVA